MLLCSPSLPLAAQLAGPLIAYFTILLRMRLPANTGAALKVDAASCSFIMKVQHLIERCLIFYLDQDECVKALSKHAGIEPIITMTVWKELEKANKEFFEGYFCERLARRSSHFSRVLEDTTNKLSRHSLEDINKKIKKRISKP